MASRRRLILGLLGYSALSVLGAVLALSVAWALVPLDLDYKPLGRNWIMSGADGYAYFCSGGRSRFGGERWDLTRAPSELSYPRLPAWVSLPSDKTPDSESATTAYGWPFLCMTYHNERPSWVPPQQAPDYWTFRRGKPNSATYHEYRFPSR